MLKQRILTAVALAAAVFITLFIENSIYWRAFISLAVVVSFYEWLRFCKLEKVSSKVLAYSAFGALFYLLQTHYVPMFYALLITCLVWLGLLLFTIRDCFQFIHTQLIKCSIGVMILPMVGWVLIELKQIEYGPFWVIALMMAVFFADIGAYFAGRRFGKTKLAPTISPGKTVEGMLGGLLLVLLSFLPILFLNFDFATASALLVGVLLTSVISVGGDLFESKMKRHVGLKDSSNILPGHGGLLDRVDSLLPATPFFAMALLLLGYLH